MVRHNLLFMLGSLLFWIIPNSESVGAMHGPNDFQFSRFDGVAGPVILGTNDRKRVFAQNLPPRLAEKADCISETSAVIRPAEEKLFGPTKNDSFPARKSRLSLSELVTLCENEVTLSFDGEAEYRIFILMNIMGQGSGKEQIHLEKSAEKGNRKSQFLLGINYYAGTVLKKNIPRAIYFLEAAGKSGVLASMKTLSRLYRDIEIVPEEFNGLKFDHITSTFLGKREDVPRWIYWLQRAAEIDTPSAVRLAITMK